ncbi:MAG: hypothetical protein IT432_01410 [Phycisphaerales bacterium]|nr:hypothetical protein [Phycisphaerales bacterium]
MAADRASRAQAFAQSALLATLAALAPLTTPSPALAQPGVVGVDQSRAEGVDWDTLNSPKADRSARAAAAAALVARARSTQPGATSVQELLRTALEGRSSDPLAGDLIATALTGEAAGLGPLFEPLWLGVQRVADERTPPYFAALSTYRTPANAARLLDAAAASRLPIVARAAYAALADLSGRDDLGESRTDWTAWINRATAMSPDEWQRELARGLSARVARDRQRTKALSDRLSDTLRKLHLATLPKDRSTFLASLLADPEPSVRDLGFELVSRELSATSTLGPEVGSAAIALLGDDSAVVRERAALLVAQLDPPGGQDAILACLERETSAQTATALLSASSRWLTPATIDLALRWLETGTSAAGAAAETLTSADRIGALAESQHQRALARLRKIEGAAFPPAACKLMASIGDDSDRRRLAQLLQSDRAAQRLAAAEALVVYPEFLDDLLSAVALDGQLLPMATRGIILSRTDAATFERLRTLTNISDQEKTESLSSIGEFLSSADLLSVLKGTPASDPLFGRLLKNFSDPDRIMTEAAAASTLPSLAKGIMLLADSHLAGGRGDQALLALSAMPSLREVVGASAFDAVQVAALVAMGRPDDAETAAPEADAWLEAMKAAPGRPYASSLLNYTEMLFGGRMDQSQQHAFDQGRDAIAKVLESSPGSESMPDR